MDPTASKLTYTRPWMYPKQLAAIFASERYGVVEASTKTGKTVGCMVWLAEQAMAGQANRNYWWVAPIYGTAKIAFRRLKRALPAEVFTVNESELTLTLANGAVIWFKGGDHPDSLYGEDVYAAVIDEATRLKEDAWHAIRSTLTATRGPVRIIGNVKGRKNWAFHLARRAEAGDQDMHYAKLTAWDAVDAGVLAREEVEDAKRTLPDHVFRELYLAEPSDDEGNPFGMDAIRNAQRLDALSEAPPRWWGWDLAKSVDWTVGVALDGEGRVCRLERWQQIPWERTVADIVRHTGHVPAQVDSTGVGDPILERLQEQGTRFEGLKFTQPSKQQLMEGLAAAIQSGEVVLPRRDVSQKAAALIGELESFEYEYTRVGVRYAAGDGQHDDCVMALALAVRCRQVAAPIAAGATLDPEPGWSDRRTAYSWGRPH